MQISKALNLYFKRNNRGRKLFDIISGWNCKQTVRQNAEAIGVDVNFVSSVASQFKLPYVRVKHARAKNNKLPPRELSAKLKIVHQLKKSGASFRDIVKALGENHKLPKVKSISSQTSST